MRRSQLFQLSIGVNNRPLVRCNRVSSALECGAQVFNRGLSIDNIQGGRFQQHVGTRCLQPFANIGAAA